MERPTARGPDAAPRTRPGLLTVAVPTMNGAVHLRETLQAILSQDGASFDLVVSDDRSEDETLAIVAELAGDRARVSVNAERLGLAGNWDRCVALSRTPYVAIIHQDDLLLPGHLALHVAAFEADPAVGLVASASTVIDAEGRDVPATRVERGGLGAEDRSFPAGEALPSLLVGNPLRCSAVSIRVAAHAQVGGFDSQFRYVVDWDFWIRVASGWSIRWLAAPTAAVRWHPASETHRFKSSTTDLEETARVLERMATSPQFGPDRERLAALARRRLGRAYLNRAHEAACARDGTLARRCLGSALRLSPALLGRIATDPRLAARLAAGLVASGLVDRGTRPAD